MVTRLSKLHLLLLFGFFCLWLAFAVEPTYAQTDATEPPPTTEPECEGLYFPVNNGSTAEDGAQPERLIAPRLPDNPTQLDCGAYQFAQICMACHGDKGQGLTDEWRAAWGTEEENCWQSGCHTGANTMTGFDFPRFAPRLIGDGALQRFETAADLHNYISTRMPWHAPGTLEDKIYWQLVAFLAESNGAEVTEYLTPNTAQNVRLRPLPEPQPVPSIADEAPDESPPFPFSVFYVALGTVLVTGMGLGAMVVRKGSS
jgi:mono/diheme cytochrome c family protein